MNENKKVEIIVENQSEVEEAIVEEPKEGFVKKAGKWIKNNGLKVLAVGAVGVISFLAGAHVAGKSDDCDCEDGDDTIEAEAYVVEDTDEE